MAELIDLYDEQRSFTGKRQERLDLRGEDEFALTVHLIVQNKQNEIFITKRCKTKSWMPDLWEIPGGIVASGEDSLPAAIREFQEETGFIIDESDLSQKFSLKRTDMPGWNCFMDFWHYRGEFNLKSFKAQSGETVAAKWVSLKELIELEKLGQFVAFSESGLDQALFGLDLWKVFD